MSEHQKIEAQDLFRNPVRTLRPEEITAVAGGEDLQNEIGAKPSTVPDDCCGYFR